MAEIRMFKNAVKSILTKENWKLFKEEWGEDNEKMLSLILSKYNNNFNHDKERTNEYFLKLIEAKKKMKILDDAIVLCEKKLELLKKLKEDILKLYGGE